MRLSLLGLRAALAVASLYWVAQFLLASPALAACTALPNAVCSGTSSTTVGSGPSTASGAHVTLNASATLSVGNANAISLGDGAVILLNANSTVQNNASTGSGLWSAGENTVEFGSNGTLTVQAGAAIRAIGTQSNGEAVNVMGVGNVITNYGLISGLNSAAIWFEDRTIGAANTVDNYGTIQTGSGASGSIIGNVIGNQSHGNVNFLNHTGAIVYGGLSFSSGDDTLTLFPNSVITGGFNGGGGTNTLVLNGEAGSSDTLAGSISNFQSLTKTGGGTWTLTGTVGSNSGGTPLAVEVQQGTLALTGNNAGFNGSVLVDAAGTLSARAQSLPPSITDNGLVLFVQPDNGTYAGVITGSGSVQKIDTGTLTLSGSNTYQGGTSILGGTVAVAADAALGAASGPVTLDGGALELTSSFNLSASRALTVTANNGTIVTDPGVTSTVAQSITGAGTLTKGGAGTLILANSESYAGGTVIAAGTLQLGNGGTAGSVLGDIVDNGTLVFNRSDVVTFGGTISGTGGLVQAGAGQTILTGDNTYTGPTSINNGWLYIDGDQSAATGPLTAASGTRLGGDGIVGGNVTIASGATLAPGAVPLTPATLTIDGNLTLNANSTLFYNVGQAGVAGGQLNDLTQVNGNLILDGVINVVDQGQTLGAGVYRIINYTGTLTDNGLTIGSYMTGPATPQEAITATRPLTGLQVQTSVPGQVNLVNPGSGNLAYWDIAPQNDGQINGGTGTWHNAGTDTHWTNAAGTPNAAWQNDAFAIFLGTPGGVTVDNSQGQVTAQGMQFAVTGYTVSGDGILLQGPSGVPLARIRVGDGTTAGTAMTATIASALSGNTLIKDDLGTLVLTADNSFGTSSTGISLWINGGTVQVSSDQNLGSTAMPYLLIANGSTLATTSSFATARNILLTADGGTVYSGTIDTASGTTLTENGVVMNGSSTAASLVKTGAGTLLLNNDNTYSGGTTISDGTLQLGSGGTSGSILGDVADNGTLVFDRSDAYTFAGTISGSGAVEQIGTGTTILTAANSYTGGTTISDGALQLGNGGSTGSITGDVTDDGSLIFDRSDTYTFDGTSSGTGGVTQSGSGVTILTADNTYTGPTAIDSGWLYIDGDQSAATGLTTAASGTRLAGDGIVGGDVNMANGSTLGPGSEPQTPATLTINGDLTLSSTTNMFYNMLQANVAGGQLNDLTQVNGNLTLDGVINVVDQGQTLGAGVYRVFNYAGTLTNNGLQIGSYMTAPATPQDTATATRPLTGFSVQTSIAHQVNLINTGGLTLTYWDAASPTNDNSIDGGTGLWQSSQGNSNWTDPDGNIDAPWTDGAYAIFMATPGTVSVDASQGAVSTVGMQFAVDGYTVDSASGDPLTILPDLTNGGVTIVRVGDGTSAGATMTATISADITGASTVAKTDQGTLVLSGTNSYTGGTNIEGGTLQVSADANLGAAAGAVGIFNGSVLHATASFASSRNVLLGGDNTSQSGGTIETDSGTVLSLNGPLIQDPDPNAAPAALTKAGAGTLVLTSNGSTYTGGTNIAAGTLQLGDGGTTGSILGDVVDDGTLAFDRSDAFAFAGAITGSGAVEQIGTGTTILTADSSYGGGTTITAGSLQLGDGGTTGSITGDVTDNGNLAFDRSDTLTFAGVVSGSGSLSQIGTGTTILTGDSSYAGGTAITAGTLQLGDGGATGSITGDVSDDGNFAIDRSDTYAIAGVVSGTGSLSQIGSGTTVLENDNSYTGDTTIAAGTLQIGNGGTVGSISSDSNISNSGVLAFDRSDTIVYGGQIRGSGSLHQIGNGTGTLILAGNNTYGGGTTIDSGTTLQLGNAGTTGSIVGNIADNGTLSFDRTDLMPLIGTISGTGDVVQEGTGTTTLHGANSYSGTTTVASGALFIDGDQSAATGLATVENGGTLGGIGTVGGSVTVDSGGTLAPGDVGADAGTLTIDQNLTLDSGAQLAYNFGQTNVVGGAFNDLTTVHGDLVTSGAVLNVTTTAGGAFDPGVYRVISYDGSWSRTGIAVGTLPSPDFVLQTAVNHQVNLVNTAGFTFNYWDGPTSPDDATIQGGDGSWQNTTGNSNWTDDTGNANAPFADASFAIFMATPGNVTIDNSLGPVTAAGMQFASDGYVIGGGTLTLVASTGSPGGAIIRVGDGTAGSVNYTATIDSVVAGDTGLIKTDLGRLVLTADNTYSGGTAINGGVLQIARDGNLGAAGTPLALDNGGTLNTTADLTLDRATTLGVNGGVFDVDAGTTATGTAPIGGAGGLTKTGDGSFVLTSTATYSGGTTISAGRYQIGDGGTSGDLGGSVRLDSGTLVFDRSDTYTFAGGIFGNGAVAQIGSGTTILTGAGTYFGPTDVASGTLQAGITNAFSRLSDYTVAPGATLDLDGLDQTVAGLTNAGTVRIGSVPGTLLTVAGNYVGVSGILELDTYLGDDSSPSDKLIIDGGTATGATRLAPVFSGGGALTTGNGILIIAAIDGGTTQPGAFSIAGPVVAGPYEYTLYRGGLNGSAPENWFLRSTLNCGLAPSAPQCVIPPGPPGPPGTTPPEPPAPPPDYRPETSLYAVIPELALDYGNALLGTFDERMGGDRGLADNDPLGAKQLVWARLIGKNGAVDGGVLGIYGDRGPSYGYEFSTIQVGADLYRQRAADGSLDNAGFYLAYGGATADVSHFDGGRAGTDRLDALTAGGYWTHRAPEGWYVDSVVQATHYGVRSTGRLGEFDTNGIGLAASVEGGYPIALGDGVVLEPQGQLTYQAIHLDDASDPGARIGFDSVQSLTGRAGVRLSRSWNLGSGPDDSRPATVWVRPSLSNEFLGRPRTLFSSAGAPVAFQPNGSGAGVKLDTGFDAQLGHGVSFYGSLSVQQQLDSSAHSFGGEIGFKAKF